MIFIVSLMQRVAVVVGGPLPVQVAVMGGPPWTQDAASLELSSPGG